MCGLVTKGINKSMQKSMFYVHNFLFILKHLPWAIFRGAGTSLTSFSFAPIFPLFSTFWEPCFDCVVVRFGVDSLSLISKLPTSNIHFQSFNSTACDSNSSRLH